MANRIARRRHARQWLYPAILAGMLLAGCSGGSGTSSIDDGIGNPPGDSGGAPGPGSGTATSVIIALSWVPSIDPVSGYVIYYGPTPQTAVNRAVQLPATALEDSESPSYSFNAGIDLGLSEGESVCFRLTSYKDADESVPSEAVCDTV